MNALTRREALAALPLVGLAHAADPPRLTLCTFSAEVTCPVGHPLMGGGIAPAKEVIDPLFAHGFVLRGAGKPVAVVAVDWCEIRNDAYDRWRKAIAEAVGTDPVAGAGLLPPPARRARSPTWRPRSCCGSTRRRGVDLRPGVPREGRRRASRPRRRRAKARPVTHVGTGQAKVEKVASNRRYLDESGKVRFDRMQRHPRPEGPRRRRRAPSTRSSRRSASGTATRRCSALERLRHAPDELLRHAAASRPTSSAWPASDGRPTRPASSRCTPPGAAATSPPASTTTASPDNRPVLADRIHQAMAAAWKETKRTPLTDVAFRSVPLISGGAVGEGVLGRRADGSG